MCGSNDVELENLARCIRDATEWYEQCVCKAHEEYKNSIEAFYKQWNAIENKPSLSWGEFLKGAISGKKNG